MHDNELSNIKMDKKIIKYVSRVVCGLITVFFGLKSGEYGFPILRIILAYPMYWTIRDNINND